MNGRHFSVDISQRDIIGRARGQRHATTFQSTPSGWRETTKHAVNKVITPISIHSLQVEGDKDGYDRGRKTGFISIHSLQVEGDVPTA